MLIPHFYICLFIQVLKNNPSTNRQLFVLTMRKAHINSEENRISNNNVKFLLEI